MPITKLEDILRTEARRFVRRHLKISDKSDTKADAAQVSALQTRLVAERQLAQANSFRYDPNRHIALLQRLRASRVKEKGASRQGHA